MKIIPVKEFGRDHWSTLAYIECVNVDGSGRPALERMRCNPSRHPGLAEGRRGPRIEWQTSWSSHTKSGILLTGHDDFDCVNDLEKAGLIVVHGTGNNPVYRLTVDGWRVVNDLRQHKANGKNFGDYSYPERRAVHA
jgi:hypothetical protein